MPYPPGHCGAEQCQEIQSADHSGTAVAWHDRGTSVVRRFI